MSRRRLPPDAPFLAFWVLLTLGQCLAAWKYLPDLPIPWYALAFVAVNLSTVALYGLDKFLAEINAWRVPERTLQFAAFAFGSPGALLAMNLFRHKTRKTSFQFVLALLILLQVAIGYGVATFYDPALAFWR